MKICFTSWAPFIGGAEVAVERLALGLAEAGHEVLLVVGTEGEALERFRAAGIRCEYVAQRFTDKLKWLQYRRSRKELVDLLRAEQTDLVHSNDLPTHQMTSDAARRLGIPRVCHHRWIFEQGAIDWLNKYGAERHLFVSRALLNELCGESPTLAACPREVVYDGLPLPKRPGEEERGAAKAALGNPSPHPLPQGARAMLVFAGQIIERKGVADLLHAWAMLRERWHGKAELAIVGDDLEGHGAYREKMQRLAVELDCPARFVGFQRNVPQWLTAADVVLVPSHTEPLGNATLEAMAHARPVIGGNVGGIPEMVVDGQTGLLVPPKSPEKLAAAMDQLLSHPELGRRMGEAGRRRCEEKFSLEAHVEAVVEQYEMVLAEQRAGSPAAVSV